jgi:hypothetical protein
MQTLASQRNACHRAPTQDWWVDLFDERRRRNRTAQNQRRDERENAADDVEEQLPTGHICFRSMIGTLKKSHASNILTDQRSFIDTEDTARPQSLVSAFRGEHAPDVWHPVESTRGVPT